MSSLSPAALLALLLLPGGFLAGCRQQTELPVHPPPLIVIGIDGGE